MEDIRIAACRALLAALEQRGVHASLEYPAWIAVPDGAQHVWACGIEDDRWIFQRQTTDGAVSASATCSLTLGVEAAAAFLAALVEGGR